jgi:hypothetical protein
MFKTSRAAAVLASLAAFSMTASPVMARDWGWGHHRHRDRIDAGDVLAGILIIGGIAAIASAASKNNKNRRTERDYRYPDDNYPQRDDRGDYGKDDRPEWREGSAREGSGGIDSAINRCVDEVSRGSTRVEEVDSVNRDGDGWRVEGRTGDGGSFSCSIDRSGRIRQVSVDAKAT